MDTEVKLDGSRNGKICRVLKDTIDRERESEQLMAS
jgi:hypothetical protein